jgi:ABC-type multidrug transport system fused ATPase/permease subunit
MSLQDRPRAYGREYTVDQQQYRQFRYYAFFGVAGLVACLLVMFAIWLRFFGEHLFNGSLETDPAHAALFLTPMIVMASLVAIFLLPMVRFVFNGGTQKEAEQDGLTIWQMLFKELADILKSYIGRGKATS